MNSLEFFLNQPLTELISQANKVRKEYIGTNFELCSIINAKSGKCSEDCKFCAQSGHYLTDVPVYSLKSQDEIFNAAKKSKQDGAVNFGIVTSGDKLTLKEVKEIAVAISKIQSQLKLKVCCSLGALSKEQLMLLKEAGLERYHHNIETSPQFYSKVVSTHSFSDRVNTVRAVKELGLEICCGGIIGLGETWQDRWEMLRVLKELDVDAVPLNIFVPIKGTPFENVKPISAFDAVRAIAMFRIVLKNKILKVAAGRESVLKDFQALAFMAGANGMLIGGYLTVRGREVKEDQALVNEINKLWAE